ncbi:MAG TPA: hypothetical protein VIL46_10885, partial [Gemmataceae bacterium]
MSWKWRCRLLVGVLVVAAGMGGTGCNPLTLPFYLIYPATGSKKYAEFELVPRHEGEPVKVMVLVSYPGYVPPEFIGAERTLGTMFLQELKRSGEANKQKIKILPLAEIEKYKREHPNWKTEHPLDIGLHFGADYVIDLEITHLSMYEPGSPHLYKGRADVSVKAYDAIRQLREPVFQTEYTRNYPRTRPEDVSDTPPSKFRLNFLKALALELSW